jgi:hypothetical protein
MPSREMELFATDKVWSAFGGGGCTFNEVRAADFCQAGAVVSYQVLPTLQVGREFFHQRRVLASDGATT